MQISKFWGAVACSLFFMQIYFCLPHKHKFCNFNFLIENLLCVLCFVACFVAYLYFMEKLEVKRSIQKKQNFADDNQNKVEKRGTNFFDKLFCGKKPDRKNHKSDSTPNSKNNLKNFAKTNKAKILRFSILLAMFALCLCLAFFAFFDSKYFEFLTRPKVFEHSRTFFAILCFAIFLHFFATCLLMNDKANKKGSHNFQKSQTESKNKNLDSRQKSLPQLGNSANLQGKMHIKRHKHKNILFEKLRLQVKKLFAPNKNVFCFCGLFVLFCLFFSSKILWLCVIFDFCLCVCLFLQIFDCKSKKLCFFAYIIDFFINFAVFLSIYLIFLLNWQIFPILEYFSIFKANYNCQKNGEYCLAICLTKFL